MKPCRRERRRSPRRLNPWWIALLRWRARHDPRVAGYFVLVLFLMLNYMKSGGFVGARDLYLFTGVLAARLNLPRDWSLALFGVPARRPG